ncbi:MAG: hypothetical protein Fur0043_03720 [Anaerolineales bacterium]
MALHIGLLLVLAALSLWGFGNLGRSAVGPNLVIFLLDGLLALAPMPLFAYRAYALWRADYILDRDSLELRWGLRDEDIPLNDIEWIRPASDLSAPLRLPWLPLPGAVLGLRRHPDLGIVEFLASDTKNLLLVGTARRVYAISPAEAAAFVQTFARTIEMGSLSPAAPKSVYPSFVFSQAWENPLVRFLWLAGLFLNIGLFTWVGTTIPTFSRVPLGFDPFGAPLPPSPAVQLILLPIENGLLYLTGLLAGLYYYRWEGHRLLAILIWASGTWTGLLFLLAVFFIVSTPV